MNAAWDMIKKIKNASIKKCEMRKSPRNKTEKLHVVNCMQSLQNTYIFENIRIFNSIYINFQFKLHDITQIVLLVGIICCI